MTGALMGLAINDFSFFRSLGLRKVINSWSSR